MAAEFTANAVQTVQSLQRVLFTDVPVKCKKGYVMHRAGTGNVTLRGCTNHCYAQYKVYFGGNIAVPTTGTAGAISVAISLNGEAVAPSTMTVTPGDEGEFLNVSSAVFVNVPSGCCVDVAIINYSAQAIEVANANLIVERIA